MSRRERIRAWAIADAQRMKDEAVLAKVTAKITKINSPAQAMDAEVKAFQLKFAGIPRGFWKDYGHVDTRVITT